MNKKERHEAAQNLYQKPRTYYDPYLPHSLFTWDLKNIFLLFTTFTKFVGSRSQPTIDLALIFRQRNSTLTIFYHVH
jgi:hypothetical protein